MIRKLVLIIVLAASVALAGCVTGGPEFLPELDEVRDGGKLQLAKEQEAHETELANAMAEAAADKARAKANFEMFLNIGRSPEENAIFFQRYTYNIDRIERESAKEYAKKKKRIAQIEAAKETMDVLYNAASGLIDANKAVKKNTVESITAGADEVLAYYLEKEAADKKAEEDEENQNPPPAPEPEPTPPPAPEER